MKRLWVRLSFAFFCVIMLSQLASYLTLLGLAYFSPTVFVEDAKYEPLGYEDFIGFWIDEQLYAGQTIEEIAQRYEQEKDTIDIRNLIAYHKAQLELYESQRTAVAAPYSVDFIFVQSEDILGGDPSNTPTRIDVSDVVTTAYSVTLDQTMAIGTSGILFNHPLALFFNTSTVRVIIQSILIGVLAGVITSRYLVSPLTQLIEAVQAFGKKDMSQRVQVKGSLEIENLMHTFNDMADELEEAEKLRLNILADVSHELRTPLTGLEGRLRACLDRVYEIDDRHIANMYVQTQHLIHLVEDLRLLAQAEARKLPLEPTMVDCVQLVEETMQIFSVLAEENEVLLTAVLPPSPLIIRADSNRIRQVLHNLLTNALRHTPARGEVKIIVVPQNHFVRFTIQDSGDGIAAEHLPYIFERFYRTDKARSRDKGGTGLGLAITKALVEAHNGYVEVFSNGLGWGSRFHFSLPTLD